ncbi:MAG: hypothetical protein R3F17_15205 [Planctomycetota bacterium]
MTATSGINLYWAKGRAPMGHRLDLGELGCFRTCYDYPARCMRRWSASSARRCRPGR